MKAARIHDYGHSDRIQIEDVSMPAQSSTDVLVRIDAAGVNPVDWKIREGYMAKRVPRSLPFTLGQDFAGQVIAVGEDVTDVEADEEVYGFANGAYAEYAVVKPEMIATKPITVDDATAASLPTPGLTALQAVRAIDPQRGQTILIHGAAGGVGSIATQLCLARGARVLATASSRDADYLSSLGVAQVIDYKTQRFEDFAHDLDAAIDVVGGETQRRTLAILKPTGKLVSTVGLVDQARGIALVMQRNADDLCELARLVDDGTIKPHSTRVLPLDQVRVAQDLNQTGDNSDKLILGIH
jgi:NADPH:quinone reductase-like Zn-dependent oxidoreductase